MKERLAIRVAAMHGASGIGRDNEGESVATGASTYEFNRAEREAALGVT